MRRIRVKKSKSGLLGVALLVTVICLIVSYNKYTLSLEAAKKQEQIKTLENKVEQLKEQQDTLKRENVVTKEEIEKIARQKLGLVYEDEIIFKPE